MNKYRHFLLLVLAMVISLGTNAMQIFVNIPSNEQLTLDVEPSDSFENVLEKIHDKRPQYQTQYMTIYFNNQPCNDLLQTLADRNVQKESTLVMEYNDNPGIQVTQDNNLDWNFIMPDHKARVDVEYYPSTLTLAADGNGTVCFRHFTVASIQVGDTLCAGDYFEGQINFMSDRIKYNGNIPQPNQMIPDYMSRTTSFGIDGLIVATGGLQDKYYAPATESGDDGNAWVVTSKNEQGITIAGVQATNTLPAGVVANDNGTYFIDYNISVTLLAVPKAGSYVKNWDNDEDVNSGGDTPKTYTQITQNFTATAHFTESPTLTLAADGNGTVELGGIVSVTNFFDNGSTIQINGRIIDNNIGFSVKYRNDNGNFTLVSNTGGIQSISFNKNGDALVYTAQAAGDNASWMTLTINTAGNTIAAQGYGDWSNYGFWFSSIEVNDVTLSIRYGSNIVNSLPAGIVATETVGQYIVSPGTEVTIKATANPGHHMASWSNNVEVNSLTEATQIFTMGTSDTTITANFALNPTLTLDFNDGGTVTCSGGKIYTSANLHQGDTLRVGDQLVGFQEIGLNQGTFTTTNSHYSANDMWLMYNDNDTITIGANGVISYSNPNNNWNDGDYTPNGNAWVVTQYNGGGSYFHMSGIQADGNSDDIVVVDDTHVLVLPGTTVRITATPDEKYYLQGWGDQAEPVISAEPVVREFVMGDHDTTITATFTPFPTLTLAANDPAKGTVRLVHYYTYGTTEVNDIIQSGDLVNFQIINFVQNRYKTNGSICSWGSSEWGSNINVGTNGAINITSGSGRIDTFTPVTENGEDGNAWRVSDIFHDEYNDQLSVVGVLIDDAITPPGIIANSDGTYSIFPGTTVTLRADATGLNHITGWSTGVETDLAKMDVITVTIFSDTTITANFAADPQVILASNNEQMGTAAFQVKRVLKPGSLHVGDYVGEGDAVAYHWVKLAGNRYTKDGVVGTNMQNFTLYDGKNIKIGENGTFVAENSNSYPIQTNTYMPLTTTENTGNAWIVTEMDNNSVTLAGISLDGQILPADVTALGNNTYSVVPHTTITVVATPAQYNHLVEWYGGNTDLVRTLTITIDTNLTATFAPNPVLTLAANNDQMGTVAVQTVEKHPEVLLSSFTSNDYGTSSFTTNDDIVRVSFNNYSVGKWGNGWTSMSQSTMTISPNHSEDYVFTRVVFSTSSDEGAVTSAPFEAYLYGGNVDSYVDLPTGQNLGESGVIAVKVYGYAVADPMVETLPDGVEEMSTGIYSVFPGTEVTVKATAIPGNHMASWSNNVEVNSLTDATQPLTVTKDSSITANFAQNPTLTLAANGDGTVKFGGVEEGYNVIFSANGKTKVVRVNQFPRTFIADYDNSTSELNLIIQELYNVSGDSPRPEKTSTPSVVGNNNVTAWAENRSHYINISAPYVNTATVSGTYNYNTTESFPYELTISVAPILPDGVTETATENTYRVLPGTVVTINATANLLRHVAGWSDEEQNNLSSLASYSDYFVTEPENLFPAKSSINVTVTGDTTMMASFGINSYTVTAKVNNDNRDMIGSGLPMGSVSATYIAVDGTPDQSVAPAAAITYTAQGASTSTLTAIPDTGYHFVKWNDDVTNNPRSLTLTVDSNLTAIFAPNSYTVTYLRGRGTIVLNVDTFKYREPITDYTPLRDGRSFIEWRPALPTYMPAEDLTVVAYWKCLSVEDYDGNVYPTVNISDICWMAANMRATHFADGREINNIYEYQCDMYPNVQETVSIFGRLYEWYDAVDTSTLESSTSRIQGICPDGWVLPNDEDFEILNNMDVQTLRSTNYWLYNNGNNSTGFDLRPAGMYNSATARYENLLGNTYLWSATNISSTEAHCHMADCNCYMLMDMVNYKSNAFSVRCIKE